MVVLIFFASLRIQIILLQLLGIISLVNTINTSLDYPIRHEIFNRP